MRQYEYWIELSCTTRSGSVSTGQSSLALHTLAVWVLDRAVFIYTLWQYKYWTEQSWVRQYELWTEQSCTAYSGSISIGESSLALHTLAVSDSAILHYTLWQYWTEQSCTTHSGSIRQSSLALHTLAVLDRAVLHYTLWQHWTEQSCTTHSGSMSTGQSSLSLHTLAVWVLDTAALHYTPEIVILRCSLSIRIPERAILHTSVWGVPNQRHLFRFMHTVWVLELVILHDALSMSNGDGHLELALVTQYDEYQWQ